MLTIFAAPKAFRGHIGVIQRNAIRSWTLLRPSCEIILLGNDDGIAEIAAEFRLRHVPDVARTTAGTPLVSGLFAQAEQSSDRDVFCYANSDIILMADFMQAVQRVAEQESRFLLVGHRWNLDVTNGLEFNQDWEASFRDQARTRGAMAAAWSIDFFVFPRGVLGEIPPFAIGRPRWDNWMLYRARSLRMPLIDVTPVVMAVHQNHDYSHHPQGREGTRLGEEALVNEALAGDSSRTFNIMDANYVLTPKGLRRPYDRRHLVRQCETLPVLYPERLLQWLTNGVSALRSLRSRFGLTPDQMRGGADN